MGRVHVCGLCGRRRSRTGALWDFRVSHIWPSPRLGLCQSSRERVVPEWAIPQLSGWISFAGFSFQRHSSHTSSMLTTSQLVCEIWNTKLKRTESGLPQWRDVLLDTHWKHGWYWMTRSTEIILSNTLPAPMGMYWEILPSTFRLGFFLLWPNLFSAVHWLESGCISKYPPRTLRFPSGRDCALQMGCNTFREIFSAMQLIFWFLMFANPIAGKVFIQIS